DDSFLVVPGIVNVGHNLCDLKVGKGGDSRHGLHELDSVDDQRFSVAVTYHADHFVAIAAHVIGVGKWRIHLSQSGSIALVAIAAMLDIQLFPLPVVLKKFWGIA